MYEGARFVGVSVSSEDISPIAGGVNQLFADNTLLRATGQGGLFFLKHPHPFLRPPFALVRARAVLSLDTVCECGGQCGSVTVSLAGLSRPCSRLPYAPLRLLLLSPAYL